MIDTGATPVVPGLVLDAELGRGTFGRVWRAVDLGTGEAVAVRVGRPTGGAEAVAREGALLRRLRHENVVVLRSVVDLPAGGAPSPAGPAAGARALVVDLVPGGSLAALVARRGPLAPGEVATIAVGVARALAYLHAHGFVHGRLTARDVLFDAQGRPLVADVGVAGLLAPVPGDQGPPTYPSPADDVLGLGRLLHDALVPGGPLAGLVTACLAPEPAVRPTPDRIAQLAARTVAPQPVDLSGASAGATRPRTPAPAPGSASPPASAPASAPAVSRPGWRPLPGRPPAPPMAPPPATHLARPVAVPPPPAAPPPAPDGGGERPARRLVLIAGAVLAGVALVAGALVLALRTDGGRAAQAPAASPSPSPTPLSDVAAIVGRLAAARADAFSSASEAALGAVDAPGSAALEQDRAFVRRLHAAGVRLEGLRFTVAGVRVVAATGDGVTVEAQVAASAYRQVRPDGTVARSVPAQPPRRVQLSLVRVGDAWRVSAVV